MKKLLVFLLLFFAASMSYATNYFVNNVCGLNTNTGQSSLCPPPNGPFATIQYALNYVAANGNPGDVIYVAPGTYFENIIWPNFDGIILTSLVPASPAEINGGGIGPVITMTWNTMNPVRFTNATVIDNFSITYGSNPNGYGGGISIYGKHGPVLSNLTLTRNSARFGGAIALQVPSNYLNNIPYSSYYVNNGCWHWETPQILVLKNILASGNDASSRGGALFIFNPAQNVSPSCYLNDNNVNHLSLIIEGVQLTGNRAAIFGGGADIWGQIVKGNNFTMVKNFAGTGGGGMLMGNSMSDIANMFVEGNFAPVSGAGVQIYGMQVPCEIYHCTECNGNNLPPSHKWINSEFVNNGNWGVGMLCGAGGGIAIDGGSTCGIFDKSSEVWIEKSKISENYADQGGGIWEVATKLRLFDVEVNHNTGQIGGGLQIVNNAEFQNPSRCSTPPPIVDQCLIVNNETTSGGAAIRTRQDVYVTNSTISNNVTDNQQDAIYIYSWVDGFNNPRYVRPSFFNCILYGNHYDPDVPLPAQLYLADDYCRPQYAFCDLQGWGTWSFANGPGSLVYYNPCDWQTLVPPNQVLMYDADPDFINVPFDYHLGPNSACIDVGFNNFINPVSVPDFTNYYPFCWPSDLDLNTRIQDQTIDLGVYESFYSKSVANKEVAPEKSNINMMPNPTRGEVQIYKSTNIKYINSIKVCNQIGNTVIELSGSMINNSGNTTQLDLSSLDNGFYYVTLEVIDNGLKMERITKKIVLAK